MSVGKALVLLYILVSATVQGAVVRQWCDAIPDKNTKISTYNRERMIGQGVYSKVYLETSPAGRQYAVKEVLLHDKSLVDRVNLCLEIKTLRQVNSPLVVKLHLADWNNEKAIMVFDYYPAGDFSRLLDWRGSLSESTARFYVAQIVLALEYLHNVENIAHRDLKPENFLVDRNGRIKLADFGFARAVSQPMEVYCRGEFYQSPEVTELIMHLGHHTACGQTQKFYIDPKAADMWVVGVMMYKMLTGHYPPNQISMPGYRRENQKNVSSTKKAGNFTLDQMDEWTDPNDFDQITAHRRLIDELLDPIYYEKTVHPEETSILEVDERSQSLVVNVWMVQDWYDEFLDWNPLEYEMINKTIVPYTEIWIPDTCLYNSESLEQKRTEALMNAIVETGYWRNTTNDDTQGAAVQLMFPAIYRLSCKMNVRFFPYDQQNCSFIISSWTHDKSTIDYHYKVKEQLYKCCAEPWVMLYAHLVIRRKPLYYIINLVIPTSIITIVAVTGFFTPSSTSSERDEKLYLGINTLLTMSIMMLMVCNQMPSTSSYVPLMSWYYMGIIFVIVFGTLLATGVLFIHSRKTYCHPLPPWLRRFAMNKVVWAVILEPPATLLELWTEYGLISETRIDTDKLDPIILEKMGANNQPTTNPMSFLSSISSQVSQASAYRYERRLASVTKQYAHQVRERERRDRKRRETLQDAADFLTRGSFSAQGHNNSRVVKKQKMMRRCSLEWEYLASVIDRCLLFVFSLITIAFFLLLSCFDSFFDITH
uniref:Protein kinase domain-containing protein n=1 Tax=Ditylenchus dipsaci TaxID=166011 RepID=A0A915EU81_9BILA